MQIPLGLQLVAALTGLIAVQGLEVARWLTMSPEQRAADLPWLVYSVGPYFLWLLALPVLVLLDGRRTRSRAGEQPRVKSGAGGAFLCFLLTSLTAFVVTAGLGWGFKDLPPLFHDEYSYQFQAWTFLAGRLYFPTSSLAPFFDQMHVLNDDVFAGRYFPGTAVWLMPFCALGMPVAGIWVLQGLIAGFTAAAAYRFSAAAGYSAGLLIATAPALIAFSNLTISPHPTMLGMGVFLWAYPHALERKGFIWPALAGLAIGYAFLCRPLTATGLGFPFAIHAIWWALAPGANVEIPSDRRKRRTIFAAIVTTFGICVLLLGAYNMALTGLPWLSPYGKYLRAHTPSHVYGFYNRTRGEQWHGPETLKAYDDWAEELTPRRAVGVTASRWERLIPWSVGWSTFLGLGILALGSFRRGGTMFRLPFLGVLGLTAAYFPYGFTGILGFGYLVEAIPWLCFVLAVALGNVVAGARARGRVWLARWWLVLPCLGIGWNLLAVDPTLFDPGSELVYPRREAEHRRQLEEAAAKTGPILVLYDADPRNAVHTTYVYNRPTLDGPIVRAWYIPRQRASGVTPSLAELRQKYANRDVYVYRPPKNGRPENWYRLEARLQSPRE